VHLYDAANAPVRPQSPALPFWKDHFVCDGSAELMVSEGEYRYEIERGPEWSAAVKKFTAKAGEVIRIQEKLARIADLAAEGWWSGETHVHRARADVPLLMRAEDLHVASVLTWWNDSDEWQAAPPPAEPVTNFDGTRFFHVVGGEDERQGGALLFHNLKQPLRLARFPGKTREWPSSAKFLDDARNAGAFVEAEKPFWWDFPMWLARGVDAIGIANNHQQRGGMMDSEAWGRARDPVEFPSPLGNGEYSQRLYYRALNCGFRIPPIAGSASGVLPNPVGYNRAYVHCDGALTWEKWWAGLRAGRVFVTNGPLLRVTANGQLPGAVFKADGELRVKIEGRLDSRDPIAAIELVRNGVIEPITLPAEITIREGGWFLVRARADVPHTYRFACTGPWYVESSAPFQPARADAQFFLDWTHERIAQLEKALNEKQRTDAIAPWREAEKFWQQKVAPPASEARPAKNDGELRKWLQIMAWHGYTPAEMRAVLGISEDEIARAIARFDITPSVPPKGDTLHVLPYPGGRHPRIGFLDGAVNPQRETKLSIFPPWADGGYVCLDVPEAIWSNLGLTYLAHTHIDTIWTKQGVKLPQLEWQEVGGVFQIQRTLPNGIVFAVEAAPQRDHVALKMTLRNGTTETLSDLRVQMCAMLKGAHGFESQTNDNKVFEPPFAACRDVSGKRWIIHAWRPIHRAWGNAPCPCLHADPKFPDCPPGETREIHGWLSFFEGDDVRSEFRRIETTWKR
jgi:hypothetical protein